MELTTILWKNKNNFFYKRYSSNRAYKPNLKTKTRFFYIQQKKLYTPYGVYNLSKKIKR